MPSLGLQDKSIEFSKLIFVAATLINEKNMQKRKNHIEFFSFQTFFNWYHDDDDGSEVCFKNAWWGWKQTSWKKKARCFIIKILFQYDAFFKK